MSKLDVLVTSNASVAEDLHLFGAALLASVHAAGTRPEVCALLDAMANTLRDQSVPGISKERMAAVSAYTKQLREKLEATPAQ